MKYNTYITDTIQKSLESVMNITEETVKDPKLKQKAIENMRKNFDLLIETKFKEKEEELKLKEQEQVNGQVIDDNKNECNITNNIPKKKYRLKMIVKRKVAV